MGLFSNSGKHVDTTRIGKGGRTKTVGKHAKPTSGKHGKSAKGSGRNADSRDSYKGGAADGLDRWG